MAAFRSGDAIRSLEQNVASLTARADRLEANVEKLDARLRQVERELSEFGQRIARLEERTEHLVARAEASERHFRQVALLAWGAILAFVANLVLLVLGRLLE